MYKGTENLNLVISVSGLGYVGLPIALEFAKSYKVIGFDINRGRVELMKKNIDPSKELKAEAFEACDIMFTNDPNDLKKANFHIIGVPTDIDVYKVPNLKPLLNATETIGKVLKKGDYVVYESTVYPGCTEEECIPILEKTSGLIGGKDFKYGYSPERIVPGDKVRTITQIQKIVSGCDSEALEYIAEVYDSVIKAGVYKASSIKVAEAAKVIENTQRDLNISLMNELAILFDRIGIDTKEVINAAGSKWNFHVYHPGLVGGHCIGVDPYYLIHKAKQVGLDPQVIAAGRRVNDYIPHFIAKKVVRTLIDSGKNPAKSRVLVMGVTFKENISDIRNSKVAELIKEIEDYAINVEVIDPYADHVEFYKEYNIKMVKRATGKYDSIVIAVSHDQYKNIAYEDLKKLSNGDVVLFDIKGVKDKKEFKNYWTL